MKKLILCLVLAGCSQLPAKGFRPAEISHECINGEQWVVNEAGAYNTRKACGRG